MTFGIQMLLGSGGYEINVPTLGVGENIPSGTASAEVEFNTDGNVYGITSTGGTVDRADWITPEPPTNLGIYEIRATVNSGTIEFGDSTGTWLSLSSTRSWGISNGAGQESAEITVEIRSGTTILDSGTITLSANITR